MHGDRPGGSSRRRPAWVPTLAAALSLLVLLGPLVLPGTERGGPQNRRGVLPAGGSSDTSFSVEVRWNGEPVADAALPTAAFVVRAGGTETVNFTFVETGPGLEVTNATLVVWFLGLPLSRESLVTTATLGGTGYAEVNWSFGSLSDLTEGLYQVDAELTGPSGQVLFDQPFYVDVETPTVLGSALALAVVVLGGLEACWVALTLRERWVRRRGKR
jgi:hypothetical protein